MPARMIAEISLAVLLTAVPIASTGGAAFVGVDLDPYFRTQRQHKDLARLVTLRMADEGVFACGSGRAPENDIAYTVCGHLSIANRLLQLRSDLSTDFLETLHQLRSLPYFEAACPGCLTEHDSSHV
jgi:hypothetical protein